MRAAVTILSPALLAVVTGATLLMRSAEPFAQSSTFVRMSDGTRVAVDLYLPKWIDSTTLVPAILHQTRYYRSVELRWPVSAFVDGPYGGRIRRFTEAGYAYVIADVRGAGASFGSRTRPWSPEELQDGADLATWILEQRWSNGRLGAVGWSYDGTAAELLGARNPPGLGAVVPQYAPYDGYTDTGFPNGVHLASLTRFFQAVTMAMDRNQLPAFMGGIARFAVRGVRPVSGPGGRARLDSAIRQHVGNERLHDRALRGDYRDDIAVDALTADSMSPRVVLRQSPGPSYAALAWSGWYDGALSTAAIARFRDGGPRARLLLGPWTHVGNRNVSSYAQARTAAFDADSALLRFFDVQLDSSQRRALEPAVTYFVVGAERWERSSTWPPSDVGSVQFRFGAGVLGGSIAPERVPDTLSLEAFDAGSETRWDAMIASPYRRVHVGVPKLPASARRFRSPPLTEAIEIAGTPVIHLDVVPLTSGDGVVTAYLREIDSRGTTRHVTEGVFRLVHRRLSGIDPHEPWVPIHSFRRSDALPVEAGEATTITFALLPIAYRVAAGHRLELVLAGCDTAHFRDVPASGMQLVLTQSNPVGSHLSLPVRSRQLDR